MNRPSKSAPPILLPGVLAAFAAAIVWMAAPPRLHRSTARPKGFRDVATQSGLDFRMSFLPGEQGESFKINLYDHGCGLAVADYDGDGDDDIYFLNQLGANALYRNCGGSFENVTELAGPLALDDRVCVGAAFGDYDNDGDQDLYVTSTRGGNVLFENQGDGRFRDVTEQAGVACIAHSETPAFFDYDADGDLDLFVTNTARWTTEEFDSRDRYYRGENDMLARLWEPSDLEANVLFRNNGDGTFVDATEEAGLRGDGWSSDVAVFDYDDDGDLDLFVNHMFGQGRLYANDGRGHFHDVTRHTLKQVSYGGIGCKAFDFNNDGRLDLFVSDMHSDMWLDANEPVVAIQPQKKYRSVHGPAAEANVLLRKEDNEQLRRAGLDRDELLFGNTLFRNDGEGRFVEVSGAAGMETFWPWGVVVGDFDNDGDLDVFLPSGMGYPFGYYPSSLMMNRGDGTFADRAAKEGIEPPLGGSMLAEPIGDSAAARSSRCAATADFDGDGRLELIVNNFNDRPYLFENRFAPRHYMAFRLQGARSNRDAIGALVKLRLGDQVLTRQVQANGGYLSQSSKTLHFGLGSHERVDRVEIDWPSGRRQTLEALAVDRLHEVIEPEN